MSRPECRCEEPEAEHSAAKGDEAISRQRGDCFVPEERRHSQ